MLEDKSSDTDHIQKMKKISAKITHLDQKSNTGCFIKNGPPYHKYFISPFSLQLLEIFSNHLTKHCKYKTLVAVTGVFSTFLTSKVVNVNQCCNF